MTVLEIGPDTIRPPVGRRLVDAALAWIDDPVGLLDDRPVAVADIWRSVMVAALGDHCESVLVIHPDDWPRHRIDRVVAAANAVADEVVAVPRGGWDPARHLGETDRVDNGPRPRSVRAGPTALALSAAVLLVVVVVVVAVAVAAGPLRSAHPGPAAQDQVIVEGRIAVAIPAGWTVTRMDGGPGSRRLQADSPTEPDVAVHITQAYAPETVPARVADALSRRVTDQPAGVFVDFRASAVAAGRPAVTYREVRPGRIVDWSVMLVGSTVVGVGCQSPAQRTVAVRAACDLVQDSVREAGAF